MDEGDARANLRRHLYDLRRYLPASPGKAGWILSGRHAVRWNPETPVWVDVDAFSQAINGGHPARAVELYGGELLARTDEEWLLYERGRLHALYLDALSTLIRQLRRTGDFSGALEYVRRALAEDPYREDIVREEMKLRAAQGQRAIALEVYHRFSQLMKSDLDAGPMPETTSLFESIRSGAEHSDGQALRPVLNRDRTGRSPLPSGGVHPVGRSSEIEHLTYTLATPNCRLVTICGMGGIGKTTLALQIAKKVSPNYRDGAYFADLSGIDAEDHLVTTLAEAVGFQFFGSEPAPGQFLAFLSSRDLLLLLDNFEQLIDQAPFLQEILDRAPDVDLLVTSRERLNLTDEWVFTLDGLATEATGGAPTNEGAEGQLAPAIALFLERGRQQRWDFDPGPTELDVIATICRLVEGVPLAIELAAAWLHVLSPQEILESLEQSLDLLTSRRRSSVTRHQSLRTVFDRSWQLLSDEERRVARQLSLFRGGFTTAAAIMVAGASLPLLGSLVDKSFLRRTSLRFSMQEVLRQYAAERLADHAEEARGARQRHATFYVDFLDTREAPLCGPDPLVTAREIETELENIRTAWRWMARNRFYSGLERSLAPLYDLLNYRLLYQEGADLFELALESARAASTLLHAQLMARVGHFRGRLGENEKAVEILRQSLALLEDLPSSDEVAKERGYQLWRIGWHEEFLGRNANARTALEESRTLLESAGDLSGQVQVMNMQGIIEAGAGRMERGIELIARALELARQSEDVRKELLASQNLATALSLARRFDEARPHFDRALQLSRELEDQLTLAHTHSSLAGLALDHKDYEKALEEETNALAIHQHFGYIQGSLNARSGMVHAFAASGRHDEATRLALENLREARATGATLVTVQTLLGISHTLLDRNQAALVARLVHALLGADECPAYYRERVESLLPEVKRVLSLDEWTRAQDEGSRLTLGEAVAETITMLEQSGIASTISSLSSHSNPNRGLP